MVVDEDSRKLIDNVVKEDDILDQNITSAQRRISSLNQSLPDQELQTSSA